MQEAETTRRFVGIDLGKRGYVLRVIDGKKVSGWNGKNNREGRKELISRLRETDVIAVESCNLAFILDNEFFEATGSRMVILNPQKLYDIYMTTKKTDREDALKLAKTVRDKPYEDLPIVTLPSEKCKERRKILSEYREIVETRAMHLNRLQGVFEHNGITDMKRSDIKTKKNRERNVQLLSGYELEQAKRLLQVIDLLDGQIACLEEKIDAEIEESHEMQTLENIPGVGKITSMAFVATLGDLSRFSGMANIGGFLGFVPKIDCSGDTVRYGRITGRGSSYLRGLLVQCAWSLVRSKNGGALKEKYEYMTLHGKSRKKAIIAIARKLAELMYTLLKTGTQYEARKFQPPLAPCHVLAVEALAG